MQRWSIFVGLDTGPCSAHATVVSHSGELVFDKPLPRQQRRIYQWLARLREHGRIVAVVEEQSCTDSFEVAVLVAAGCDLAIIPGCDVRSVPSVRASTEPNAISKLLALTAQAMPESLQQVSQLADESASAAVLGAWVADVERDLHLATTRLETTVSRFHPALARACVGRWQHRAVLDIFETCGGPVGIDRYTTGELVEIARPHAPRAAEAIAADLTCALAQQDIVVPGAGAADRIVQTYARQVRELLSQLELAQELWNDSCDASALADLMQSLARPPAPTTPPRPRQSAWPVASEPTRRPRRRAHRRPQ